MPTIKYGLNRINQQLINDKAKSKPNGIYSFRGVVYRVVDMQVTHYADCLAGQVLSGYGHFNVIVSTFEIGTGCTSRAKELLKGCKDND